LERWLLARILARHRDHAVDRHYLFGFFVGPLVWGVQMLWIPFWAAGILNGVGMRSLSQL
jgi:hypothetical protein